MFVDAFGQAVGNAIVATMQKPSKEDLEKAYAKFAEQLKKRAGELRANSETQNKHTRRGYAAGPVQEPGALIPISDAELLSSFEQEQYNRLKNETQATLFEKLSTLLSGNSVGEGFKDILSDSVSHLPHSKQTELGLIVGGADFLLTDLAGAVEGLAGIDEFVKDTRREGAAYLFREFAGDELGDWMPGIINDAANRFAGKVEAIGEIYNNRHEIFEQLKDGTIDGVFVENFRRYDLAQLESEQGNYFEAARQRAIVGGRTIGLLIGVGGVAKLGGTLAKTVGGSLSKLFGKLDVSQISSASKSKSKLVDNIRADVDGEMVFRSRGLRDAPNSKMALNDGPQISPELLAQRREALIQEKLPRVYFTAETRRLMGPAPEGMINPHRHHILEVNGRAGEHRAIVREGQEILREFDIDPLQGIENLVWAPNKGHTIAPAELLVEDLRAAQQFGLGREEVIEILARHGRDAARRLLWFKKVFQPK